MSTTETRPVRIHLAMPDNALTKAIRQIFSMAENQDFLAYVDNPDEADLIFFIDVHAIERFYCKEKTYVYLGGTGPEKTMRLPPNCKTINNESLLVGIIEAIHDAHEQLGAIAAQTPIAATEEAPLRPDALTILVIDDTPKHIASAKAAFAGHLLTTLTGYEEAMDALAAQRFDVVLTDLQLPMSSKAMGAKFRLGELVHYGVLLMIEAARQGAKYVAVVTDVSHHDDPFSAAFDHFRQFPVTIENAKVMMMHASLDRNGAKDWMVALNRLMT